MFDFDDIEGTEHADAQVAEQEAPEEVAERIARGLERGEWKVRYDSCRELAKLGLAAAPYMQTLETLAERDKDNDVRKAAGKALQELREAGIHGTDAVESDPKVAEEAASNLSDKDFSVRRNACRMLGKQGALAAPHLPALQQLALHEKDYEVRQAARDALRNLRSAGFHLDEEDRGTLELDGAGVAGSAEASDWWPKALFQVGAETLPMRLENEAMTPFEITEIWEKSWGVQYAGRIRFAAHEDSETKWLRSRNDIVPRTPFVVRLEANSGTLLQTLAAALRLYGRMTPAEVAADREQKLREQMLAAERRAAADAREDARYQTMDHRRRWRPAREPQESMGGSVPRRVLGRTKLGCG